MYNPGLQRKILSQVGTLPPSAAASPIVISQVGHPFAAGDAVYGEIGTGFAKALNTAVGTLGRYIVATTTLNSFTIARPGDVVTGFVGLTPYEWYHSSPTTPGALIASGVGQKPSGCFAANPLGQALTSTDLLVQYSIPYEA
jgi:hypothetical protein